MKYILYNEMTGEVADIIATILENQPMIMPPPDPFEIVNSNWDNCATNDKHKADRALFIFVWHNQKGWRIKEIVEK